MKKLKTRKTRGLLLILVLQRPFFDTAIKTYSAYSVWQATGYQKFAQGYDHQAVEETSLSNNPPESDKAVVQDARFRV